jgi:hypothetical protein
MNINIPDSELVTLKAWTSEKIQAVFDDPWGCVDDETELVSYLTHLRNICTRLNMDYLEVARREATSYEIRALKKILPTCDLIPNE